MLSVLDWIIIGLYLLAVVIIGIACRGRQESAEDYFTSSGGLGGMFGSIMVGLSIAATLFSGISFLAYPSVVYSNGISLLLGLIIFPLAWIVLTYWFLPKYLSAGYKHPYEILERRFGPQVRLAAAVMFVLLRIGWMAALIYAPALAIMTAGGLGENWFWPIVLAIGISSTLYTTIGGIRGVIVTDAIQFLVIAIGIAFTIGYILMYMPVPLSSAWGDLGKNGYLNWFNFSFDLTKKMTFWSIIIGFGVANMASYMADQMSLQRYLATGQVRPASRSFAVNVIGVVVVLVMLAGVGLALRSWYQYVPDAGLPQAADKILPYFIATALPAGLAGLVLAAILAATMSSMTSGINALSGTLTLDFCLRAKPDMSAQAQLRFARIASIIIGLLSTLVAGLVSSLGSIFDIAQTLLGVFLGPLLAVMILAMIRTSLGKRSIIAGMIAGVIVGWGIAFTSIASLWVGPISLAVTCLVAVILSWLAGLLPKRRD